MNITDTSRSTPCPHCDRFFRGIAGLNIHTAAKHPEFRISAPTIVTTARSRTTAAPQQDIPFHVKLAEMRRQNPIVRIIPKGARKIVAEELVNLIENVVSRNDEETWKRLLGFFYGALKLPGSRVDRKVSLATEVKKNLREYMDELTNVPGGLCNQGSHKSSTRKDQLARRVEAKLAEGEVRGAVRLLCSDDDVSDFSTETLTLLQEKHPAERPGANYPDAPANTALTFLPTTALEIVQAVASFPNGSAGGLDGLRPQHLKTLINLSNGDVATKLTKSLARLVDLMLEGKVPDEVCTYLYGANLTALNKKDGGIRPIAVGNTFRRLAGKIVCHRIRGELGENLQPHQLGFGSPAGAEAVVHATRRFLTVAEPPEVLLKLDFKNAFNSIHRDYLLRLVLEQYPNVYPFVWQCYRHPTILTFGNDTILSASGVQQGDPLGPALFCLAIKDLTRQLKSSLNVWYLDDGTLGGSLADVLHDVQKVQDYNIISGLCLNPAKCEVRAECADDVIRRLRQVLPGLRSIPVNNMTILGSPLSESGCHEALENIEQTTKRFCERLAILSPHPALYLLVNCLGIPKLLYLLRTAPTWLCLEGLKNLDEVLRQALQSICNVKMEGIIWSQATLPVSKGGLGLRSVESLALPAFLSSSYSSMNLVESVLRSSQLERDNQNSLLDRAHSAYLGLPGAVLPSPEERGSQSAWDNPLSDFVKNQLINETVDRKSKARLLAVATKESGYWLQVLPSPSLGTLLNPDCLRIAVALRLGSPMCVPHRCGCGVNVDESGHHGLSCRRSAGRFPRHHALNETLRRALVSAGVPAILEPPGISREDGKRPDGMSMVPWSNGRSLLWDATCVDTLAPSHVQRGAVAPGVVATEAEDRKRQKYMELTNNYIFCPVGVETLGVFGPSCRVLLSEIGRRLTVATGDKRSTLFLMQRISVDIQRGNAAAILGTLPSGTTFYEIYNLL